MSLFSSPATTSRGCAISISLSRWGAYSTLASPWVTYHSSSQSITHDLDTSPARLHQNRFRSLPRTHSFKTLTSASLRRYFTTTMTGPPFAYCLSLKGAQITRRFLLRLQVTAPVGSPRDIRQVPLYSIGGWEGFQGPLCHTCGTTFDVTGGSGTGRGFVSYPAAGPTGTAGGVDAPTL